MKKYFNYFFYTFIIAIFIGINILIYLVLNNQKRHDSLYMQYAAETVISEIIAAINEKRLNGLLDQNNGILGFGIYDSQGSSLFRYGSSPANLIIYNNPEKNQFFKFNSLKNTFEFLRPLGMMPFGKMPGMNQHRRINPMDAGWMKYIYLEMLTDKILPSGRGPLYLFILFSTTLAAIMILAVFLYKKNEKYKELHERQMQLVQLGEASRTIAHEIKNPLSSIKIQTSLLRREVNEGSLREIDIIDEEVGRIKNISDKVRDFLGDPLGIPEIIDPEEFIKTTLSRYVHGILFENRLLKKTSIQIDPERLRSILENVMNNALESSEENKPIKIILRSEKDSVIISVIDEGRGIKKSDLKSIFDPFFTTKIHGLGLGLSLVKKYIEAAGGRIEIESGEGGTTANLHFKSGDL